MNEQMFVPVQDISYEKYLWTLLSEINETHFQRKIIGTELCERTGISYPIYRITIHPEQSRKVCVIGGVHGNEIAGPLALLSLLTDQCERLPHEFQYVLYPIANPTGFDLRQRFDDDYRDLNALYKTTLESENYQEVQVLYEDLLQFQPYEAVITLHEDSDVEQFYMYGLGEHNRSFYHAICAHARQFCAPWQNADIYGCQSDEMGLVLSTARDHAFDGYLFAKRMAKVACTLETPGKLDIGFRVHMMVELLLGALRQLANE
jgi:predicted deacylase